MQLALEAIKVKLLNTSCFIDNLYLKEYCLLIATNLETKKEKLITEKHHILPKSYYKMLGSLIDNSSSNLVNLKFSDHILAHYYLYLCASNDRLKRDMAFAFMYMTNNKLKVEDHILSILSTLPELQSVRKTFCEEHSKMMLGENNINSRPEVREKKSKALMGRRLSAETKLKLSESRKGKYAGKNAYWYGKKFSHSEETKLQMSLKRRGENNPNYGKKASEETRAKISAALTGREGRGYLVEIFKDETLVGSYRSIKDAVLKILLQFNLKCKESTLYSNFAKVAKTCESYKGFSVKVIGISNVNNEEDTSDEE